MAIKFLDNPNPDEPEQTDDFRVIKGIGPAVATRLYEAGITTFAQLAKLSAVDIAALLTGLSGLSSERIAQQKWIEQAHELATQKKESVSVIKEQTEIKPKNTVGKSEQAIVVLEFELKKNREINTIRAIHVQSRNEQSWEGWDIAKLEAFLTQNVEVNLPENTVTYIEPIPAKTQKLDPIKLEGEIKLNDLVAVPVDTGQMARLLDQKQSFKIQLGLDLTDLNVPEDTTLNYFAAVYAKQLDEGGRRKEIGEATGTFTPPEATSIAIDSAKLAPGFYRLEAEVKLAIPEARPYSEVSRQLEGSLLKVY